MDKLLTTYCAILLALSACNTDGPKLNQKPNVNDLVGTWVSADSALFRMPSGFYVYRQDTLVFSTDTLHVGRSISPYMLMSGTVEAYYQFDYSNREQLDLNYLGPKTSAIQDTIYTHRMTLNSKGDTLILDGFPYTYPMSYFDKYYKVD